MKTKERDIYELLIVMRDNFDKYFVSGLCRLNHSLWDYDLYSYDEYYRISAFICENRPNKESFWGWPIRETEPRKRWLDKQIKLTKPKRKYSKWAIFRIKIK